MADRWVNTIILISGFSKAYTVVVQNGTSYVDYFKLATEKTNPNGYLVSDISYYLHKEVLLYTMIFTK